MSVGMEERATVALEELKLLTARDHLDGVCQDVHAALKAATGLFVERDDLGHTVGSLSERG